jgi:SpoVK/Ycf46/Vps4 family AAA+-type ATPase
LFDGDQAGGDAKRMRFTPAHTLIKADGDAGFSDPQDHLLAELGRIHALLRARIAAIGQRDDDNALPGLSVSASELDTLFAYAPGEHDTLQASDAFDRPRSNEEVAETARRREAARRCRIPLRLDRLSCLFDLTSFDLDVLLICLLPEVDLRYERAYAYLHDDVTRKQASVGLILDLLCPTLRGRIAARTRFSPGAPLVRHRLLAVLDDPAQSAAPLVRRVVKLDDRIVGYLLGEEEIDERVSGYCTLLTPTRQQWDLLLPEETRERLQLLFDNGGLTKPGTLFQLYGPDASGKEALAEAVCQRMEVGLLRVDVRKLARLSDGEVQSAPGLLAREAALTGAGFYLDGIAPELADAAGPQLELLVETVTPQAAVTFLASGVMAPSPEALADTTVIPIEFALPDSGQRQLLWRQALGDMGPLAEADLATLAGQFRLSATQIHAAVSSARSQTYWCNPTTTSIGLRDLQAACRQHSNRRLANLARRIVPHYGWDDIVLPPDRHQQLTDIFNAAKFGTCVYSDWGFGEKLSLGKGLSVLFSGSSGTGKTMAAEIIAGALGLDLYRIDLSLIVSKFIGETEKNLARIFAEAETANAILFFDEADALFGKRSEVRDAHDRYANLEISYLLQRMEAYEGIAILATNLGKNLDEAFLRRLHFIVDFPLPDAALRREIWGRIFPARLPRAPDIDFDLMARRFEFAGGNIKNVALAAAFTAAANGGVVRLEELLGAARREYQKMGKLILEGDFVAGAAELGKEKDLQRREMSQ